MVMKTVIFPGTFDPITHGHSDLITKACQLFDKVIIAVAENPGKKPLLAFDERINLITQVTAHLPAVSVAGFTGLLVDFAKIHGAHAIIRSLRSAADFDHESQLALMNQQLEPSVQTVFLMPNPQYAPISSTLVREIASLGGNVEAFVSPIVAKSLKKLWP